MAESIGEISAQTAFAVNFTAQLSGNGQFEDQFAVKQAAAAMRTGRRSLKAAVTLILILVGPQEELWRQRVNVD